jgi:hypothetical protein
MASKCSFQVPDSDFHVPACAPFAPRQQERTLLRPQVTPRAAHFAKGRGFPNFQIQNLRRNRESTRQDCHQTSRNRESTRQDCHQTKNINQTVDYLFWFISFRRSAVRFPASSFRCREPDQRGISSFQLPASSFSTVDVKKKAISSFQSPPGLSRGRKARSGAISSFRVPDPLRRGGVGHSECISL